MGGFGALLVGLNLLLDLFRQLAPGEDMEGWDMSARGGRRFEAPTPSFACALHGLHE